MGHNYLSPDDALFKLFYYFGYLVLFLIAVSVVVVTADWLKEKKREEGEESDG
ncbi:hypothetical protein [Thermovibrio ammonificans]|uniref:Uncharacterized protein n=1 Tax=Thermovibrio ammonificans (strain DSM 15698 / JCM 12110 / HB-1) TaxID=648996 RepID=E8T268_THEA1|nr:hypothetical protein [Thermovibrio ammonificans]ADU96963.1 hypothetical protein Theam_0996 [Thermovibrio ammonificans HB-1]